MTRNEARMIAHQIRKEAREVLCSKCIPAQLTSGIRNDDKDMVTRAGSYMSRFTQVRHPAMSEAVSDLVYAYCNSRLPSGQD